MSKDRTELPPIPDWAGLESRWPDVYDYDETFNRRAPTDVSPLISWPEVNWRHRDFDIDDEAVGRELQQLWQLRETYGRSLLDLDLHDRDRDPERVPRFIEALHARDVALAERLRERRQRPDEARKVIRGELEYYASQLVVEPYPWERVEEIPAENTGWIAPYLNRHFGRPPATRGPDKVPRRRREDVSPSPAPPKPTPAAKRASKSAERCKRVLGTLRRRPAGLSKRDLKALLHMGDTELATALAALERDGEIRHETDKGSRYVATKRVTRKSNPKKSPKE